MTVQKNRTKVIAVLNNNEVKRFYNLDPAAKIGEINNSPVLKSDVTHVKYDGHVEEIWRFAGKISSANMRKRKREALEARCNVNICDLAGLMMSNAF